MRNKIVRFRDYEIPVLQALAQLGGFGRARDVLPLVQEIMSKTLNDHPEEYDHYKYQKEIIWKNKTRWAREYLKRKGQLDGLLKGVWIITDAGESRLSTLEITGMDPDEVKPRLY